MIEYMIVGETCPKCKKNTFFVTSLMAKDYGLETNYFDIDGVHWGGLLGYKCHSCGHKTELEELIKNHKQWISDCNDIKGDNTEP